MNGQTLSGPTCLSLIQSCLMWRGLCRMRTRILIQPTVQHSHQCYSGITAHPSSLLMLQRKQLVPGAAETQVPTLFSKGVEHNSTLFTRHLGLAN